MTLKIPIKKDLNQYFRSIDLYKILVSHYILTVNTDSASLLVTDRRRNRVLIHLQRIGPDGQKDQHWSVCPP